MMMQNVKKGWLVLFLLCFLLCGCALREHEDSKSSEASFTEGVHTDIPSETESPGNLLIDRVQIMDFDYKRDNNSNYNGAFLGMQFYQGEPVLLWGKPYETYVYVMEDGKSEMVVETQNPDCGLYAYKMDGSGELLLPGVPLMESLGIVEEKTPMFSYFYMNYDWFVDEEGYCYCIPLHLNGFSDSGTGYFLKLDKTGKLLYKTVLPTGYEAEKFCSFNGNMYVAISRKDTEETKVTKRLVQFEADTGVLAETDAFILESDRTRSYFGSGVNGIYLIENKGILKINPEDKSSNELLSFSGSAYSRPEFKWKLNDFRILEDGSVEILYFCGDENDRIPARTAKGLEERLTLVNGDRSIITLRAATISGWLKNQTAKFNKSNGTYWVTLEEFSTSTFDQLADYAKQTNVELATGKGPDILCGNLIEPYAYGLLNKGLLLDMSAFAEASGIRREDYLPSAFGSWQNEKQNEEHFKIYGINVSIYPRGHMICRDILTADVNGTPDIYTLMNALSNLEGEATYYEGTGANGLLKMFLEGSEDLWGMIDWETGSCDFSSPLFAQILENAGRFDAKGIQNYKRLLARPLHFGNIYQYDSLEELENEKMVMAGILFDDGCFGAVDYSNTLAINNNSSLQEGAWEYICYLLAEEAQSEMANGVPVNKAGFELWMRQQLAEVSGNNSKSVGVRYMEEGETVSYQKTYTRADITDDRIAEYLAALENARVLPFRTQPILDIIYEEAGAYLNGAKSIEDVSKIIQNRVQLYLDEQ
jgi:ABC-type glycerol-3-phosphate transport system substrate-binding protein